MDIRLVAESSSSSSSCVRKCRARLLHKGQHIHSMQTGASQEVRDSDISSDLPPCALGYNHPISSLLARTHTHTHTHTQIEISSASFQGAIGAALLKNGRPTREGIFSSEKMFRTEKGAVVSNGRFFLTPCSNPYWNGEAKSWGGSPDFISHICPSIDGTRRGRVWV